MHKHMYICMDEKEKTMMTRDIYPMSNEGMDIMRGKKKQRWLQSSLDEKIHIRTCFKGERSRRIGTS
jgi:hypothetical protein